MTADEMIDLLDKAIFSDDAAVRDSAKERLRKLKTEIDTNRNSLLGENRRN